VVVEPDLDARDGDPQAVQAAQLGALGGRELRFLDWFGVRCDAEFCGGGGGGGGCGGRAGGGGCEARVRDRRDVGAELGFEEHEEAGEACGGGGGGVGVGGCGGGRGRAVGVAAGGFWGVEG